LGASSSALIEAHAEMIMVMVDSLEAMMAIASRQ
jgi:hypothetical protein